MKRTSSAQWLGDGKSGKGSLTTQSGALKAQPYSFKTRFESEDGKAGTNPEELIAAAHAGCFTMAIAFMLSDAGFPPQELDTTATLEMKMDVGKSEITGIALDLKAKVPGITADQFQTLAETAKANCPVSKALSSIAISLTAALV